MLTFALPAALAGFAALPALWWLHRARMRPVVTPWPSLLLWKKLPPPSPQALARHRRRTTLSLVLALLAAAAFTAGAAGPAWEIRRPAPIRAGVVVDATASARGAFEAIRADADAFLAALPADAVVDLALVPQDSWTGLTAADARLRVATAEPTDAPGDPAAAAARFRGADIVAAFSDRPGPEGVAVWRVHPAPADARAVVALAVEGGEGLAVVRAAPGRAAWTARVGGAEQSGEAQVPASGHVLVRFAAPDDAEVVFSVAPDSFPANDARYRVPGGAPVAVGFEGPDFPALRRALEGAGVRVVLGGQPTRIWYQAVPDAPPAEPAILIAPPKDVPGLFRLGSPVANPVLSAEPDDPLVRTALNADLARLTADRVLTLTFDRPSRPAASPFIHLAGSTLVLPFDPAPAHSNWTRLVSFPLFWADAARLLRPAPALSVATGAALPTRSGPVRLLRAGIHDTPAGRVAANLDDPAELAATPAPAALPRLDLPEKVVIRSRVSLPTAGGALAGLVLVLLAWLVARRRP